MRRVSWVVLIAVVVAGSAVAVTKGSTLYVRTRNTRLVDKPNGKPLATLQPGQKVTWNGVIAGSPGWHQVVVNGKKGALLTANLASKPPVMEILATDGTKTVDQSAFLSSAAATKALAPAAEQYGNQGNADMKRAVRQVQDMEALSDAITSKEITAHVERAGLLGAATAVAAGGAR